MKKGTHKQADRNTQPQSVQAQQGERFQIHKVQFSLADCILGAIVTLLLAFGEVFWDHHPVCAQSFFAAATTLSVLLIHFHYRHDYKGNQNVSRVTWILGGIGVVLVLLGAISFWYESRAKAPFFIDVELSLLQDRNAVSLNRFYVGYISSYGQTLTPVDITMFLRLVNLQPFPSVVQDLAIEAKIGEYPWIKLTSIPILGNHIFWVGTANGFSKASEFAAANTIDVLLQNKAIEPHVPIRGWVYLDVPRDFFAPSGTSIQYRITIRDSAGVQYVYTTEPATTESKVSPPGSSNTVQSRPWQVLPGYRDLTAYKINYYYEPLQ